MAPKPFILSANFIPFIEVFKGEFSMVNITEIARNFSVYLGIAIVE